MMKSALLTIIVVTLPVLAGPPAIQHISASGSKDDAIDTVSEYYSALRTGITRRDLKKYWTRDKLKAMDATASNLALIMSDSIQLQHRRLIDMERLKAACEDIKVISAEYTFPRRSTVSIKYEVRDVCATRADPFIRHISLNFSQRKQTWLINTINNESEK
jgi:hypothetical protein